MVSQVRRYASGALVARSIAEAFPIAFVLVAHDRGVSSTEVGVVLAASTAPQLVTAPWIGGILDRTARPTTAITALAAVTTLSFAAVFGLAGRTGIAPIVLAAAALSLSYPALMGGLSGLASRSLASEPGFAAWDAFTYGVGAIVAQAWVAVFVLVAGTSRLGIAVVVLAGIATAALATLHLQPSSRSVHVRARDAWSLIVRHRELRAITILTTTSMAAFGGAAIAAVDVARRTGHGADAGAQFLLAMAIGAAVGAVAVTRLPAARSPLRQAFVSVAFVAAGFLAALAGPWWLALVGALVVGIADAPLLTATFSIRTSGSPDELRASVYTVSASLKVAATAVGAVVTGAVAGALDGRATMLVAIGFQVAAIGLAALASAVGRADQ